MSNKKMSWGEILSNSKVADAYKRFTSGASTRTDLENEFKNTEFAGSFRSLVRSGGSTRAKTVARKALQRRKLI